MSRKSNLNNSHYESAIRKEKYKDLLDRGGQAAEEVGANTILHNLHFLNGLVQDSNELISQGNARDRVGQTAEVVLDAQVVKLAHDLMGTTCQHLKTGNFTDDEYARAILRLIQNENVQVEWPQIDPMVFGIAKTFRYSPSMFGTFEFEQAEDVQPTQKQRQQRRKAEVGVEKKPISLTQPGTQEKGSTKMDNFLQQIKEIYRKNNGRAIPYYKLIIDPANMMYTFENSFQVSFLFHGGWISYEMGDDNLPAIRPMIDDNRPPRPAEMTSFVATLDHNYIQQMIKKYKIKEPLLKINRELYTEPDSQQ